MTRCADFYAKWQRVGNFCEKNPRTAEQIDQYLELILDLVDRGIPEERAFAGLPEFAARPLLNIQDEEIRDNAISSVSNALESGKNPITGKFSKKLTSDDVKGIVERETTVAKLSESLFTSDSEEWYTPREIIEAVLDTFGGEIDLDPCSNDHDAPNVPAKKVFTKEDNGLKSPWEGRVYLNPPYGRGVGDWIQKLLSEYQAGNVTEAVVLVAARTDTQWFNLLGYYPWCAIKGRLAFSGCKSPAPFPSAVFYIGKNLKDFYLSFSEFGPIYYKLDYAEVDTA